MDIVQRAKNICLTPKTEWPVIAAEPADAAGLLGGYAAPLAAIGAIAGFIGGAIVGTTLPFVGHYRVPFFTALIAAIFTFGMMLVGVFVLSLIIDALAPTFGGQKNSGQALKVAVYSYTPAWIAGVLQIVPLLGILGIFAAFYGVYLLFLGLPRLMKAPEDKALPYTAVVLVCAIVLSVIITMVAGMVVGTGMAGAGMFSAASSTPDPQFDKNSPMGKLEAISKKLDESNKKMEAAAKSGDSNAQVAAAVEGLGALLGGGTRIEPVATDELKPLVPDTFAGLAKTGSKAEKNGALGLMMSRAEGTYTDGADKRATLEITDTGGVSGITALAGWASVEADSDDENESERTYKADGRLVHEKRSKSGGSSEFAVIVADRFVVTAKGTNVALDSLKSAVSALDLGKLESLKGAGVKKD
jgi:hypothetical protein